MLYYYSLLIVFAVIVYMMVVDENVAIYINLMWKMAGVQFRRFLFIIKFKPRLMWDTWNLKRTIKGKKGDWADKEALKLLNELNHTNDKL